ncbi:MAG: ribonuclease HII [Patescibacteria group bacterium]
MKYIIGIDEVGRGSLAGPVAVAAASITRGLKLRNTPIGKLKDSKKLTPKKREAWFRYAKAHSDITYEIARVYPRSIEKINISNAANRAATKALGRLIKKLGIKAGDCTVMLDGGLYLRGVNVPKARTIIRGDERYPAIKLASIVAKVSRDRFMTKLAKKYPVYGFEIHKGYGTKAHFAAIKKHGPSKAHRLTFL